MNYSKLNQSELHPEIINDELNDNAVNDDELHICEICLDDALNLITCDFCNKQFCRDCLRMHLGLNKYDFKCPHCLHPLSLVYYDQIYSQKELVETVYMKIVENRLDTLKEFYSRNIEDNFLQRIPYHCQPTTGPINGIWLEKSLYVSHVFNQFLRTAETRAQENHVDHELADTIKKNSDALIQNLPMLIGIMQANIKIFNEEFDKANNIINHSKVHIGLMGSMYTRNLEKKQHTIFLSILRKVNLNSYPTLALNIRNYFITNLHLDLPYSTSLTAAPRDTYRARFGERPPHYCRQFITSLLELTREGPRFVPAQKKIAFNREKCPYCDFGKYELHPLNQFSNCDSCGKSICKNCNECHDEKTKCNPNVVANRNEIQKCSKPCPNCGIRIIRGEGCPQMFCTYCKTGFDWNTGSIIRSNFHNPHRMEWLKGVNDFGLYRDLKTHGDREVMEINRQMNADTYIFLFREMDSPRHKFPKLECVKKSIYESARYCLDYSNQLNECIRTMTNRLERLRDDELCALIKYRINDYGLQNGCIINLMGVKHHWNQMFVKWKLYKHLLKTINDEIVIQFYTSLNNIIRNHLMLVDQAILANDYKSALTSLIVICREVIEVMSKYENSSLLKTLNIMYPRAIIKFNTTFDHYPMYITPKRSIHESKAELETELKDAQLSENHYTEILSMETRI